VVQDIEGANNMKVINNNDVIENLAVKLRGSVNPPEWASYVKTGHGKQRPPVRQDWWYVRAAAVLLSVQKLGPVGVSKLSVKYGTRKDNGVNPASSSRASRNVLRKVLQQLESSGLLKQEGVGVHKGRTVTIAGVKLINDASKEALKGKGAKNV
jgi:small subunit ribosomal protein S19e